MSSHYNVPLKASTTDAAGPLKFFSHNLSFAKNSLLNDFERKNYSRPYNDIFLTLNNIISYSGPLLESKFRCLLAVTKILYKIEVHVL